MHMCNMNHSDGDMIYVELNQIQLPTALGTSAYLIDLNLHEYLYVFIHIAHLKLMYILTNMLMRYI